MRTSAEIPKEENLLIYAEAENVHRLRRYADREKKSFGVSTDVHRHPSPNLGYKVGHAQIFQ